MHMNNKNDTTKRKSFRNCCYDWSYGLLRCLIIVPIVVSLFFLWDWYVRGFSTGSSVYDGELLIGLLLLIGNLCLIFLFYDHYAFLRKNSSIVFNSLGSFFSGDMTIRKIQTTYDKKNNDNYVKFFYDID